MANYYDCIVIGAGAAGLMCAATAGQLGKSTVVLDHANKVGKKILMSGGGRCNFTNYFVEPGHFISANPHFCKSALKRYTPYDFIALVDKYQLAYHEKARGQLFCDNKSKDILDILLAECEQGGVSIQTHCPVDNIQRLDSGPARFRLNTRLGEMSCRSLVIATGGLSIPTMGASGFGYRVAEQFGLTVTERAPALVPFTLTGELLALCRELAGLSLPVAVTCGGQSFSEQLLFTHRGLSGPAMLQISNYWYPQAPISIDFLPGEDIEQCARQWRQAGSKTQLKNRLSTLLPKRFTELWLAGASAENTCLERPAAELANQSLRNLSRDVHAWRVTPAGTEGYRTAEVTRGGVDTAEVSSQRFESHKVPGLFFIGEVLDVTGWLGGYNFQWAWSSAYCAAQYV